MQRSLSDCDRQASKRDYHNPADLETIAQLRIENETLIKQMSQAIKFKKLNSIKSSESRGSFTGDDPQLQKRPGDKTQSETSSSKSHDNSAQAPHDEKNVPVDGGAQQKQANS